MELTLLRHRRPGLVREFPCIHPLCEDDLFSGISLQPIPPGGTAKSKDVRWIDIREDRFDEAQMAEWIKQAAALPGWTP